MVKKRGGQPKHWAEIARVKAWYGEVKRLSGLTDYKLDFEFAWTDIGVELRRQSPSAECRPRTFEWIRKAARKPKGLDPRWRGMTELVQAVDQDSRCGGTQALFEAEIWDLLQETAPTPEAVQRRIDRLLVAHGLVRLPAEKVFEKGGALLLQFGAPSLFDRSLRISLRRMNRFSGIALVWLLYLQTEPVHNAPIRTMVELIADKLLDHFFADYLPDDHFDYYDDAIGTLFKTRLDLSSRGTSGYGYLETIGTWPVVPKELAGKLTEKNLM